MGTGTFALIYVISLGDFRSVSVHWVKNAANHNMMIHKTILFLMCYKYRKKNGQFIIS